VAVLDCGEWAWPIANGYHIDVKNKIEFMAATDVSACPLRCDTLAAGKITARSARATAAALRGRGAVLV
jgi:hypothetical protein